MANAPTVTVTHRQIINDRIHVRATLTAGVDTYGNGGNGLPISPGAYGMTTVDFCDAEALDSGVVGAVGAFIPKYDSAAGRLKLYYINAGGVTGFGAEIPGVLNMVNDVIRCTIIGR